MNTVTYSDLKKKTFLITGATRGIGREIALALARQNASVVFNYREGKENQADLLISELKENGVHNVDALKFDVNDTATVKEQITSYCKEHGNIDGLVNNAGISKDTLLLRLKEVELSNILDTNLKSAIMLTSILSRYFLRVEEASIVNVSSVVALMGNSSQSAYAASKAGLIGFTKSVAKELASKNIRCNAIAPGFITTDMTNNLQQEALEHYKKSIPLQRFGSTQDVSKLVLFLLSNNSSYITGEVIKIDGGLYI